MAENVTRYFPMDGGGMGRIDPTDKRAHGYVAHRDFVALLKLAQSLADAADKLANPPFGVSWDTGLLPRIKSVNKALAAFRAAQEAGDGSR